MILQVFFLIDVELYIKKKFLFYNIHSSCPDHYYSIHTHSHLSNTIFCLLVRLFLDTLHFCYKQNFLNK